MRLNTKIAAILGVCAIATKASAQTFGAEAAQTNNQVTDFSGNFPTRPTDATEGGRMYRGDQMNQDNNYNRGGDDKMNGGRGQGKGQMNGGDRKEGQKDRDDDKMTGWKGQQGGQKNEGRGQKDDDNKYEGEKGWMNNGKGGKGQKDEGRGQKGGDNKYEGQGEKGWMSNGKGGQKDRGDMKKHRDYDNDDKIHRPMNGRHGYKWTDDERDSCDSASDNEDRRIRRWGDNDDDNEGRKSRRGDRKRSNKKGREQEDSCEESGNDTDKWTDREDDCDSEHEHGDRHDDDHDNKRVGRRHNKKMNFGMRKHNENRSHKKRWGQEEDSCEESGNDTDKCTDREDDCYSEHDDHDNKRVGRRHNKKMNFGMKKHNEKRWGQEEDSCEESGNDTDKWTDREDDCESEHEHGDHDHDHKNGRGSHHLRGRFTEQTCDNENDCYNNGVTSISEKEVTKTTTKFGLSPAFIVKLKDAQMRAEGAKVVLDGVLCDLEQAQDEVEKADRRLTKLLKKIVHQKKGWGSKKNHSE